MTLAVLKKSEIPDAYLVVTEAEDGSYIDFAYFSGPDALDRAIVFAGSDWYDGWADPENLASIPTKYTGHY